MRTSTRLDDSTSTKYEEKEDALIEIPMDSPNRDESMLGTSVERQVEEEICSETGMDSIYSMMLALLQEKDPIPGLSTTMPPPLPTIDASAIAASSPPRRTPTLPGSSVSATRLPPREKGRYYPTIVPLCLSQ